MSRLRPPAPVPSSPRRRPKGWSRTIREGQLAAEWNGQSGVTYAPAMFWRAVDNGELEPCLLLIDAQGEAEANPGRQVTRIVPAEYGANVAPADPIGELKDIIAGLTHDILHGDPAYTVELSARYAALRGRLEVMQQKLDEAVGMLDMAKAVLHAQGRSVEHGAAD